MELTLIIFVLVYIAMGFGTLPGFKVDRTGAAIVGALAMMAVGSISTKGAWDAIDYRSVGMLFGLMVVSAAFAVSGFYARTALRVTALPVSPPLLLAVLVGVGGALSSLLTNDVVVVAMTPLLVSVTLARGLNPVPFLLAFCFAANTGSSGTLIGSPQNMIAAQSLDLSFNGFLKVSAIPSLLSLPIAWGITAFMYRGRWTLPQTSSPQAAVPTGSSQENGQAGSPQGNKQTGNPQAIALQASTQQSETQAAPAQTSTTQPTASKPDAAHPTAPKADASQPTTPKSDTTHTGSTTPFSLFETLKATVVALAVVLAFVLSDWPRELIALTGAGVLLISRKISSSDMLKQVDGDLILLIMGLFVVNAALSATGLPQELLGRMHAAGLDLNQPFALFIVGGVLSNIVGNNPTVMLLVPYLHGDGATDALGAALALGTGFSSNLIIFGSLAGIIVVEQAAACGIKISFKEFARAGIPVTLATMLMAALWILLIAHS